MKTDNILLDESKTKIIVIILYYLISEIDNTMLIEMFKDRITIKHNRRRLTLETTYSRTRTGSSSFFCTTLTFFFFFFSLSTAKTPIHAKYSDAQQTVFILIEK
jgi:hypothetical protein